MARFRAKYSNKLLSIVTGSSNAWAMNMGGVPGVGPARVAVIGGGRKYRKGSAVTGRPTHSRESSGASVKFVNSSRCVEREFHFP